MTDYMIAGVFEYYITKLNKDMISFAEKPRKSSAVATVWINQAPACICIVHLEFFGPILTDYV
jgi:hypothetical protein